MKHLYVLPVLIVLGSLSAPIFAQPTGEYLLETLDQPYVQLIDAFELDSVYWDENAGWDNPDFTVPLGFEFELSGVPFSELTQGHLGATFYGGTVLNFDSSPFIYLVGPTNNLADLGVMENDSLGNSRIRWQTAGSPGEQVFTLEYENAGLHGELSSVDTVRAYSSLNLQLRLFEATGVIEVHYGASFLREETLSDLQESPYSGWHGFFPGNEAAYNQGLLFLTNINEEVMYDDFSVSEEGVPFDGFPEEGRLFRYTPAVVGCHLEDACNFDEAVNHPSPETCIFPEAPGLDCDGLCLSDLDNDGVCDVSDGCTDGLACNYDPSATNDDGSCVLPNPGYDCDGLCLSDLDNDGVCDANEIPGCNDPVACNYEAAATDWEPCEYAQTFYNCEGECLMDTDGDGVCDELEQPGCTDEDACNYQSWATEDDGTCIDSLGLTLVGDTLVSVGDTLYITVEGPFENYNGNFSFTCWEGMTILQSTSESYTAIVGENFESCTITYFDWDLSYCSTNTLNISLDTNVTSLRELEGSLQVYPNPVSSSLTLDVPQGWASGVDARMVSAMGQTVWSERLSPGTQILDVSGLPNGMHLLMYEDRTQRVLIQR